MCALAAWSYRADSESRIGCKSFLKIVAWLCKGKTKLKLIENNYL